MLLRTRFAVGPATCLQGEANIQGIWTHILDTVSDLATGFPPALGEKLAKNVSSWHPPSGETPSLSLDIGEQAGVSHSYYTSYAE